MKDAGRISSLEDFEAYLDSQTWLDRLWTIVKWNVKNALNVKYHLKRIKWFWQRGKRGYSDSDVWDLFAYLLEVLVPALEDLNRIKHGPVVDDDEEVVSALKQWNEELQIMIDGFKAAQDITELDLEDGIEEYTKKHKGKILDRLKSDNPKDRSLAIESITFLKINEAVPQLIDINY